MTKPRTYDITSPFDEEFAAEPDPIKRRALVLKIRLNLIERGLDDIKHVAILRSRAHYQNRQTGGRVPTARIKLTIEYEAASRALAKFDACTPETYEPHGLYHEHKAACTERVRELVQQLERLPG